MARRLLDRNNPWVVAVVLSGLAWPAHAGFLSFSGNLPADDPDAVAEETFTVLSDSDVTFESFSYAGGTNGQGTLIPAGGFDPILGVFNSSGSLVLVQDDGSLAVDPVTDAAFDFLTTETLLAGTYTATITAFSNFPNGPDLDDGFEGGGDFVDFVGEPRSIFYAFDVSGDQVVPLPAAAYLFISGGLGILGLQRLRLGNKSASGWDKAN